MSQSTCAITADLHIHSTASDGCLSPEEIVDCAYTAGLSCIALSDHDTTSGVQEASTHAREAYGGNLSVIPALEMSTQTDGRYVHLLGYFIDCGNAGLAAHMDESRALRMRRAVAMAERLSDAGYDIDFESAAADGAVVNRMLLARALVEKGYAASTDDAFCRLLGTSSEFYVESEYLETIDAIRLVLDAGGFPFIAHPAQYRVVDLIPFLKREGLCGIEVYHTRHSNRERLELRALADELDLAVSGGSDWHGDDTHGASLASAGLDRAGLSVFLDRCEAAL